MIAVFDIDGVLADATHRQHFVESRPKDWDAFFSAVGDDAVIERGRSLLLEHQAGGEVVLVSGRPERTRGATQEWLSRNGIAVARVVLRRDADHRPAAVTKAELIEALGSPEEVTVVVDDDPSVTDSLTRMGYATLLFR